MFLWFVATAIVSVWFVFRDPGFDYRLLIVGSVLPLADGVTGGASVLHTLAFCLSLLAVVMLATIGRRPTRKLLARLAHRHAAAPRLRRRVERHRPVLVAARRVGLRRRRRCRRWPGAGGTSRSSWSALAVLVWVWRASGLSDPAARRRFLHDGRLFTGTGVSAVEHSRPC